MGFSKEEKPLKIVFIPRWVRALFFLTTMFISLLLFSAPILLIISDALLPSALLSATLPPPSPLTLRTLSFHLNNYDFRHSLIDIPLVSIIRSAFIFCVYSFCDGPRLSRWPYLGITTVCAAASLAFVSLKGSYVFRNYGSNSMAVALFISSVGFAIGHVVVAYRTSCRERRKLLIYKIDIEAVSACKNGFPIYHSNIFQLQGNKY